MSVNPADAAESNQPTRSLSTAAARNLLGQSPTLAESVRRYQDAEARPQNRGGEADIAITSGHADEPVLPGTFADYELAPREYELAVAQTVLRAHSRVADLFNDPMDQVQQQLRLTVEALRERQENEMVNNPADANMPGWRGVPMFPCNKIPVTAGRTTSIIARARRGVPPVQLAAKATED